MSTWGDLTRKYAALNVAEKLIAINVVLFIFPFLLQTIVYLLGFPSFDFIAFFELSPRFMHWLVHPWTLISYGFFHGSFGHILWNMLLFYTAAQIFLNLFHATRLINLYFTGIFAGGVVFLVSYALFPVFEGRYPALIGSSAGVMAVLIFCCTYSPQQVVRVLFFNIKLQYIGIALVLFDVVQIPTGNAGGHLAHLGGALIGFLTARAYLNGTRDYTLNFYGFAEYMTAFRSSVPLKTVYRTPKKEKSKTGKTTSNQAKIDDILDKISASGYDSLTKKEKEFLFKAGKK